MKVVLFCGGMGMRMRPLTSGGSGEFSPGSDLPKPMVQIGPQRPLLWHVMKYYAHFGHKDFVLCLGYKGETIKNFFLNYNEYLNNNFVMEGGERLRLLASDIQDWRINFVDTGLNANLGERLMAVREFLDGEDLFYCNYSDGLCDLPLDEYTEAFLKTGKTAGFITVEPQQSYHVVDAAADGTVRSISPIRNSGIRVNGGYFVFRKEIFDYMRPGEELVVEPFQRMIEAHKLFAYRYDGFWTSIDTFKEKQELDERWSRGDTPWKVWQSDSPAPLGKTATGS